MRLILLLSLGSTPSLNASKPKNSEEITIFIHGVLGARFSLSFYHLFNLVRDNTENTVYEKVIEGIRNNPFFYENQPIAELGLKKMDIEDLKVGNASVIATALYDAVDAIDPDPTLRQAQKEEESSAHIQPKANILNKQTSVRREAAKEHGQTKHSYYTYGWSGLLSKKARKKEGEEFLTVLEQLIQDSKDRNYDPKLHLVSFSHGGNICAQLGHAHQKKKEISSLSVDELIMIGTPILQETEIVLKDPLFKRIYNIYSPADTIQTKEIFSGQLFSGRKFEGTKQEPLPTKLTQIELRVQKDRIKTNRYTQKVKNFGTSDYSPGHMELWFFGWTPNHYRTDYPLHPLPTFVFIPFIIHELNKLNLNQHDIVVTLHPEQNRMQIGNAEQAFLSAQALNDLKKMARAYAPEAYSLPEYRQHCKEAYWNAREERAPLLKRQ